jgi:hypothetical protein
MNSPILVNANPIVYEVKNRGETSHRNLDATDNGEREWIDAEELFDWIRSIHDPEHPYTLEQLHVVMLDSIIRVRLMRCLPRRFKITIKVTEGSHQTENQVNRQLNDKERVAAAMENQQLLQVVNQCLASCT